MNTIPSHWHSVFVEPVCTGGFQGTAMDRTFVLQTLRALLVYPTAIEQGGEGFGGHRRYLRGLSIIIYLVMEG